MARSDAAADMDLSRWREALDDREARMLRAEACLSRKAVRRKAEPRLKTGHRQAYAVDADRILHSRAYARYIDKTQVFSLVEHDHVTHRVLHVQLVSKVARTIGRFLGLNEDLIEAIALGHDIGHPPFGHEGEGILADLCMSAGIGRFRHNVQSVLSLDRLENTGRGWNLTLQTLDGILCHNGEIHQRQLTPDGGKTFDRLEDDIRHLESGAADIRPMTLEGCVVRVADTIAYIGRDIEDAIRLGLIRRSDIPAACRAELGDTNGTIVYRLVTDLIRESRDVPHIAFSEAVATALKALKAFNYARIYLNPRIRAHLQLIEQIYRRLFEQYVSDVQRQDPEAVICSTFLASMPSTYREVSPPAAVARDFIAGMTDRFFLKQVPKELADRVRASVPEAMVR
ncbi:MAG: HD domain-containing protein [Pseudomonadota bacterium]